MKKKNPRQSILDEDGLEKDAEDREELLAHFSDCVLPRDKEDLLKMLKESVGTRFRDLIGEKKLLQCSFHLYLVLPELVSNIRLQISLCSVL